ncbi:hypothetical protein LCM02_02915 [Lutimonas saemankumensis]|uniref:S41 family peptidase n=1 Tax=Lutimonas saemankumensis TaxID=483016 RepID=UPI001CD4793C|nr:S41 family peptidase [Lutimonas saemankumensis]MCA0931388.1 hypothetical protein [Lutimonas saemankumensis]
MKQLTLLLLTILVYSCQNPSSNKKDEALNRDLISVTDSISQLMSMFHYNPEELKTEQYFELEEKVLALAKSAKTNQEFVNGFNAVWSEGPFSHVRLSMAERSAEEMADFIDSIRVGEQSVSLDWIDKNAILTVSTMTGVDTKERVFQAYRDIDKNNAQSLIIDLRKNKGGTFAGVPLIGHILSDSVDAGVFVSRKWWENNSRAPQLSDGEGLSSWHGWSIKTFWKDVQQEPLTRVKFGPMNPHFEGPVYVLISTETASAAEFAVDALAREKKVTIIGETSAGEMLSQKMYDLPNGFQLSVPIAEYYSSRIGRIEGKGVKPDIQIDQRVALDLALSIINEEKLEDVIPKLEAKLDEMDVEPFSGEKLYLFGSMNDWGKKWNDTPEFTYKGNGVFETVTTFQKGNYEFKIAPMSWDFDFGANSSKQNVSVGKKTSLVRVPGSSNLMINVEDEVKLKFTLDVRNEKAETLIVSKI